MPRSTTRRVFVVATALTLLGAPTSATANETVRPPRPPPANPDCRGTNQPLDRATELVRNVYRIGPHPAVQLSPDLRWTEDPLRDDNWQFDLHGMRYVLDLLSATRLTGNAGYARRAVVLVRDWIHDNPRRGSASRWAWNDHTTALRAIVLTCLADERGLPTWLRASLLVHGATLADPAFARREGNHALNQAIALLEVGRVVSRRDWTLLAGRRINDLIATSVDRQGVTNEQSVKYELFNYQRYVQAKTRMVAAGLTPSPAFRRIARMPAFLAAATLPNGGYEMLGDSVAGPAVAIPGTPAEFAATRGGRGTRPNRTVARYEAGFLFARTGWGEVRAPSDETFLSVRWGSGHRFHGHADGLALTIAAWGSRLLVDPGSYSYTPGPFRSFFKGRSAHNVVTVDGLGWNPAAPTELVGWREEDGFIDVRLRTSGYSGVVHTRRITWLRGLDVVLVEDDLVSAAPHTYRQLWHLADGSNVRAGASSVWTRRPRGNVLIEQLGPKPTIRIVSARTSPVQGWISYHYGQRLAAPVVEAIEQGRTVRYLTLIAVAPGRPTVDVTGLRIGARGYRLTLTIGDRVERVATDASSIWVVPLSEP